ncbi:sugar phosphate isomerase/epimerase [Haloferula luteola]|uniref:Sugar phosphate isomerase/epimerase n=1 Tax=Haloferula luteola TaxID=595692 RepID=A0A840V7S3_9BACT|nr:metabolite traffic protein EboE [Haloferula luteola]MBB5353773.1 sugar phosphate isomerase/epimerase [Haloferula luteola]
MHFDSGHLAYCTNIHPAESWDETHAALVRHALKVRDLVAPSGPFAIGLRLSARAARELLAGDQLARFRDWLESENAYVFTINGFPYGNFHGTRVKEKVFQPDWTDPARLEYTKELFTILSELAPLEGGGSVSTLPGSHKTFHADEALILDPLIELAGFIDALSEVSGRDLHLGLEPEPLGHFENTQETLRFFDRLLDAAPDHELVKRRIGINYDSCHFALQYEDPRSSLGAFAAEGLRISKIHLSAAVALDPRVPGAVEAIRPFDEPTYFHQVIARHPDGQLERYVDLPDGLAAYDSGTTAEQWRVHFHIPLDAQPAPPLRSTRQHAADTLAWCREFPGHCHHFEIETYTWGVLPAEFRREVEDQIAAEYRWVLA